MSASLVGSEMCIRDSPGSAEARPGGVRVRSPCSMRRTLKAMPRLLVLLPVSYTHLTLPTICSV
eukprot:4074508-Alexandrium_andersonii.AAC.1